MSMPKPRRLTLDGEEATAELAAEIASLAEDGDVIALSGELGTGKTTFARAFLREWGVQEEIPSPTFTLVQTYELEAGTVWHFDLYRLEKPDDALELDIEDAFTEGISLIEWPERLGAYLPWERLDLRFAIGEREDVRRVEIEGTDEWADRLTELEDLG